MKYLIYLVSMFSISSAYGQSELTEPETGCKFVLPWTCETCTFSWSGDCIDKLPNGIGSLTVFNEGTEIMWYEGEMKNGKFDGAGKYRDGMNQLEGDFQNGDFVNTHPFITERNARLDTTRFNKSDDWELNSQVTKQLNNFYFTFPASGYAFKNRDALVEKCLEAFKQNCALIKDPSYTEFTKIRFVTSKNDMLLHANLYVSNIADIKSRSIHMTVSEEATEGEKKANPPIIHEVMHMVSMTAWGTPPQNNNWLNEGLATYAANNCSGFSVSEIYRFFLEEGMLLSPEQLSQNFFQSDEMIGYHQSAYIVEYLINNFGIERLETFWKQGFSSFESIYGLTFSDMISELNKELLKVHPKSPKIDWEVLGEGCK